MRRHTTLFRIFAGCTGLFLVVILALVTIAREDSPFRKNISSDEAFEMIRTDGKLRDVQVGSTIMLRGDHAVVRISRCKLHELLIDSAHIDELHIENCEIDYLMLLAQTEVKTELVISSSSVDRMEFAPVFSRTVLLSFQFSKAPDHITTNRLWRDDIAAIAPGVRLILRGDMVPGVPRLDRVL